MLQGPRQHLPHRGVLGVEPAGGRHLLGGAGRQPGPGNAAGHLSASDTTARATATATDQSAVWTVTTLMICSAVCAFTTVAALLDAARSAATDVWREWGLQPWRDESFKFSTDPRLEAKVRDVVGQYLNPPDKAVVLCVDAKPQAQAYPGGDPGIRDGG
jgi:hypothetical protein